MKIPTLLAIDMLLVAIALGLFLYFFYSKTESDKRAAFAPSFISVVNKSDTKASIVWQTNVPTKSEILWGPDSFLSFTKKTNKEELLHFITLDNLSPNSEYFLKVKSDKFYYPINPVSFKTYPTTEGPTLTYKPIIGAVLNQTLKPVSDALVLLKVEGGEDLAAVTSSEGIFILPTSELKEKSSNSPMVLNASTKAQIIATFGNQKSQIAVVVPPVNEVLPPIVLGQDSDFTNIVKEERNTYDLNGDGEINSLDLAIVRNSFGKQANNPADLNLDGVIDQNDVNIIRLKLGSNNP